MFFEYWVVSSVIVEYTINCLLFYIIFSHGSYLNKVKQKQ